MVLLIIIPIKWLFHWEYTLFSDKIMYVLPIKICSKSEFQGKYNCAQVLRGYNLEGSSSIYSKLGLAIHTAIHTGFHHMD